MSPLSLIAATLLLPVVVLENADDAEPLGAALKAGGLPVVEVTFRTKAAEESLRRMAKDSELTVGAGTVIRPDQVDRAVAAGASFIVSPGLSAAVVRRARELGVPVIPGIATASEIVAALDLGLEVVKLFPAETLGGTSMVRAMAAPFPTVKFVPTGGIQPAQLTDYLQESSVLAVGGSWMVATGLVAAGRFDEITRLTAQAVNQATAVRGEA